MENITFECPSCGQVLETPAEAAGQIVGCPNCETEFEVPSPAPADQAPAPEPEISEAPAPEPSPAPDDSSLLSKLGGATEEPAPAPDTADDPLLSKLAGPSAASQGTTGGGWGKPAVPAVPPVEDEDEEEAVEEQEEEEEVVEKGPKKIGLRVKTQEVAADFDTVPSTEEGGLFEQPVYTGPTWHLPRWVKLTMSSVLSVIFIFTVMCFVQFGDSRTINLWMDAEEAVQNPRTSGSLKSLEMAIRGIKVTDKNRDMKIGLMAAYGLGLISAGDMSDGQAVCKYLEGKYRNNPYTDMVIEKRIVEPCRVCKYKKPEPCPVCKDNKKCLSCDGAGFKRRGRLSGSSGGLGNGFRRFVGRQNEVKADESESGDTQKCVSCDGKGVCPNCKGSGRKPFFCTQCKGEKEVLSLKRVAGQNTQVTQALAEPLRKKNRIGKLLLTIQAMKFGIGSKPSAPSEGIDPAEASILFSKVKVEETEDFYKPPEDIYIYDDSNIPVADALVAYSMLQSRKMGLDPEALRALDGKVIKVEEMKDMEDPDAFKKFLSDNGLVAKVAPLTEKAKIPIITTASSWGYSLAVMFMSRGAFEKAYASVESVEEEGTELGDACKELKELIVMMGKDYREIKKIGKEADFYASRIKRSITDEKKQAAFEKGSGVVVGLVEYTRNVAGTRSTLSQRFDKACEAGMVSEARMLLGYLISEREQIQTAAGLLKEQGVKTDSLVIPAIPASVTELYEALDRLYNTASNLVQQSEEIFLSDIPKSSRNLAKAYYIDRASLKAKIGMSYGIVANHFQMFVAPKNLVLKVPSSPSKVKMVSDGIAMGLGGEGPVRVGVGAVPGAGVEVSGSKYAYWTLLGYHALTEDVPMPFVKLSKNEKYPFSVVSGRQAYKYLIVDHEAKVKTKGFLVSYKSGSSAGATDCFGLPVTLAALSSYTKKEYRDDVVCSGGIEADGTLLRVRGTAAKVRSVSDSKKLQTIVLPLANKSDLAALTIEDLCKCVIVLSENIDDCMDLITKTGHRQDVLDSLNEAQKLILGGQLYEGKRKLVSIGLNNDVYNIGRLLELLTIADL